MDVSSSVSEKQQGADTEAAELAEVGGVPELTSDAIDNDQVPLSQGVSYGPVTLPPHLKINLWACTTRAWSCFRQQPWMAVFATIVFGALIACGALAGQFILGYALVYVEIENPQTYWALFWNAFLECLARFPLFFFLPPMSVAYFCAAQDFRKRGHIEFITFFGGFRWFFHLLLIELVVYALIAIGIVALLVPGLVLFLLLNFVPILFVAFPQLGIWKSFKLAIKQTIRYWATVLAMLLLKLAILVAGALCLGVGVLCAIPVAAYTEAFVFSELFVPTPGVNTSLSSSSTISSPQAV